MVFKNEIKFFNKQDRLIEACKKNNRKAQLQLYDKYYKAMYTVSLNMVKDTFQAEDLMQEAFISAFTNINNFRGEVSFGSWLKKIVINKCIDYLKKKKVQFESIDSFPDIQESTVEDEKQLADKKAEQIKAEINNLPDGYRTVLNLYLIEGFDHEEIAQILGITASTSRSQYSRAKTILIKKLSDKE